MDMRLRPPAGPSARPRAGLLLLALAGLLLIARGGALAEEDAAPARLSFEEAVKGQGLASSLPAWAWRPGHATLVRRVSEGGDRLEQLDPATGATSTLLDLDALGALVDRPDRMPPRAIGRAPRPHVIWASSGRRLVVVVRGDLVWVDLERGARRRLTSTASPLSDIAIAPDERHVRFTRDHDLWVVAVAGGEPWAVTKGGSEAVRNASLDWLYPEELGIDTAAAFSPDSRHVAWLQLDERRVPRHPVTSGTGRRARVRWMRYPRAGDPNPVARVAVSPTRGGEPVWLDLGSPAPEYVCRMAWLPDGRSVAVVVLDRAQEHLRLLACPIDGSPPRLMLEERDPGGAWIDVPPAPHMLPDGSFLWRSDRDGRRAWWHVVAPRGGQVSIWVPLTAPGVDVTSRPLWLRAEDRVLYTGIPHGGVRAAVYDHAPGEAAVATFQPRGPFDTTAAFEGTGTWAVLTWSLATVPPRRTLVRTDESVPPRMLGDGRTARWEAVEKPDVEYGTLDPEPPSGIYPRTIRWRLWKPRASADASAAPPAPRPVVVRVYGGPGSDTLRDRWGGSAAFNTWLVQQGYFVLQIDGRGTRGYGPARERAVARRLGLHELEDQVAVVQHLAARPEFDGERVAITGWSYGGTMTCLALTKRSDVFSVGVAMAPVTDWRLYDTIYTERYMGLPSENGDGYRTTSVLEAAGGLGGHLLVMHGLDDDNVHPRNTMQLVAAVAEAGREGLETVIYPNGGHGIGPYRLDVHRRLARFLATHLR